MDQLSAALTSHVNVDLNTFSFLKLIVLAAAAYMAFGLLGRVLLGKRSGLNHAVSSAIGILCLYILGVTLYSLKLPYQFLLTSLPFIQTAGETLTVFSISTAAFPALCTELLRMVMLAFLVNLLDSWLPEGENIFTWYLFRLITIALALALQYAVFWVFGLYLPEALAVYAPAILVVVLLASLLMGVLKLVLGLFLATINPIIAAFYAFFFSNTLGKKISKAVLTTLLLSGVVYGLNAFGFTTISITSSALVAFLPAIILLLVLWYVVRKLL